MIQKQADCKAAIINAHFFLFFLLQISIIANLSAIYFFSKEFDIKYTKLSSLSSTYKRNYSNLQKKNITIFNYN